MRSNQWSGFSSAAAPQLESYQRIEQSARNNAAQRPCMSSIALNAQIQNNVFLISSSLSYLALCSMLYAPCLLDDPVRPHQRLRRYS